MLMCKSWLRTAFKPSSTNDKIVNPSLQKKRLPISQFCLRSDCECFLVSDCVSAAYLCAISFLFSLMALPFITSGLSG